MSPSEPPERPATPKELLAAHGLRPRRSLGQNFLADQGVAGKIAELTLFERPANVVEIGAGLGALTLPLLQRGQRVTAIETDRELSRVARARFAAEIADGRLELVEADAREVDLEGLLTKSPAPRVLAGNLPYHLSGLLLRGAVDRSAALERAVFLLQLEVVDRLCAVPDSEAYGALSVFTQAVFAPRRAFVVRRGAFYPQPNVDSAVVVLTPLPEREPIGEGFSELVKRAFTQRRKTLRRAWQGVFDVEPPQLERAAAQAGIDLGARGETLGVPEFRRMARALGR